MDVNSFRTHPLRPRFLFVPSYQLKTNRAATVRSVVNFVLENKDSKAPEKMKVDPRLSPVLHRGKSNIFAFPDELQVCGLSIFPFLQAAMEGQRQTLSNLISEARKGVFASDSSSNSSSGGGGGDTDLEVVGEDLPLFDPLDIPIQCRGGRWEYKEHPRRSSSNRVDKKRGKARLLFKSRLGFVQPTSRIPDIASVMEQMLPSGQKVSPENYKPLNGPKYKPNACNLMSELASYLPFQLDPTTTACAGKMDASTVSWDEAKICQRCCLNWDVSCWKAFSSPRSKKLPTCCIRKISQFLSAVSFFMKIEICGQSIGCSGVREGSFVTPS